MWIEFVVGSRPCSEGFSPCSPVFLPPQKTKISKFQFNQEFEGHGFISWRNCCVSPSLNKVNLFILFTLWMTEIQGESILVWVRDCAIIIRGGGAPKNELRKEEYCTVPPSQQREISSTPGSKSPKNYDAPFLTTTCIYSKYTWILYLLRTVTHSSSVSGTKSTS